MQKLENQKKTNNINTYSIESSISVPILLINNVH
jgi:hypothetical protein